MQTQYVPAIVEMGRAARHGQLALLSEYSWFGGALAGEYQHGVFSAVHVVLCACVASLSPARIASSVSLFYYALAAAGAYRAARVLELRKPLALAVALVAALNGFNVTWGSWLPAITGWAWLMWLWWSLERLRLRARPRFTDVALVAFSTYGVLAAGWHFADLLILPLVLAVAARRPHLRFPSARLGRMGLGLLLGGCLALPAMLCFIEYARAGGRTDFDGVSWVWTVPWQALQGLLVPLSTSHWSAFGEDTVGSNVVMAGGVLPVVVVLVALVAPLGLARRSYVGLVVAAGLVLACSMLPSPGRVRWPFRWLPVFHLLVVLAAAQVLTLASQQAESTRKPVRLKSAFRRQLLVALVGAGLIGLTLALGTPDANTLLSALVGAIALVGLPLAAARGADLASAFCGGVVLNLLLAPLLLPARTGTPTWSSERCTAGWAKVDHAARYLGVYCIRDIIDRVDQSIGRGACLLPGSSTLLERVPMVNGYSTLYVAGLHRTLGLEVHGELNGRGLVAVTGPLASPGGLLDRWGIDGLVMPTEPYVRALDARLRRVGFVPTDDLGEARIWRREAAARGRPLLESLDAIELEDESAPTASESSSPRHEQWRFDGSLGLGAAPGTNAKLAALGLTVEQVTATRLEATIRALSPSPSPGLILLRRPWLPGYRATLDGKPLTVGRLDGTLVGVVIPPGQAGRLKVEYVPLGLRTPALVGVLLALLALASGMTYELAVRGRLVTKLHREDHATD